MHILLSEYINAEKINFRKLDMCKHYFIHIRRTPINEGVTYKLILLFICPSTLKPVSALHEYFHSFRYKCKYIFVLQKALTFTIELQGNTKMKKKIKGKNFAFWYHQLQKLELLKHTFVKNDTRTLNLLLPRASFH